MRIGGLFVCAAMLWGVSGCKPIGEETPTVDGTPAVSFSLAMAPRNKVDVLFLVDNSNSMESMQSFLKAHFFEFFRPFDDLAKRGTFTDFHIGVVTSDLGAGATGAPGCMPGLGNAMLQPSGGDEGKLIARGKKASPDCLEPKGHPYVEFAYKAGGQVESNLPDNQGLAETFTCMASVGAQGCGFEHQLEAVRQALLDPTGFNKGFLRPDATLAVVFLTNEDDASAPRDIDVFDKNLVARYGYEDSYSRQTRFAVQCDQPLDFPPYGDSGGPMPNCRPAPNWPTGAGPGAQFDVRRYIELFNRPFGLGGIKDNPGDVILYAIDAPEEPFQVILSNPGTPAGQPYVQCNGLNEASNPPCVPVLQHSCVNLRNPDIFGDPAVRLNTVVRAAPNHKIWSICDEDYGGAMHQLATLTAQSTSGAGCLPEEIGGTSIDSARVDCTVSDVLDDVDHEVATPIPQCAANVAPPCWRLESKPLCEGRTSASLGVTIDRGGSTPPPNTHPRASCNVKS